MNTPMNLTNQFLIAMPSLEDPNFAQAVTYICEHNDQGAMGIIINHPLDISFGEVLTQLKFEILSEAEAQKPVFSGGPVLPERGFILHRPHGKWDSSLSVSEDIAVTSSRDILDAMAKGEGPEDSLFALGYAGWSAGQLEAEMSVNSWLSTPANSEIIFRLPPEKRWQAATRLIGIDPSMLSGDAGHA